MAYIGREEELLEGYEPRSVLAIDLKCFYASVECLDRGLDPFQTPLAVADPDRGDGTIVLAVSPFLKAVGVPGRCRRYELPDVPGMIIAVPRMHRYLEKSAEVTGVYLDYVAEEDLHVYSVDESFLDVTHYLKLAHKSDVEYARQIVAAVKRKTGLTVCAGIGENVFLAKVAMDLGAKRRPDFLDKWTREDLAEKLWPVHPLSKMWGIGRRLEARLNKMGFEAVGDLACADPKVLSDAFGIKGEELYLHANGIDRSILSHREEKETKSLSVGQVLFFDASPQEALGISREMGRALMDRARKARRALGRIDLAFQGSEEAQGWYGCSLRFERPVETSSEIEKAVELLARECPARMRVRAVRLVGGDLIAHEAIQSDLLTDWDKHDRDSRMDEAIARVRQVYGKASILRCSALLERSTEKERLEQIGGHRA